MRMPEQRRRPRRQMVPRFQSVQAGSRSAPPPVPPAPPPAQEIPRGAPAGETPNPPPPIPPELRTLLTDFPDRLKRLDGETLLLLGLLWMLWQDKADRRLLIALAYILL